ncbi:MAG TPA: type II toxin-antitoxin system HipA family toxin [Solirubrobacteraceae bacterium]|nr:type II toxin-antitoxin system HipA family toxin [Solirubrobacteraceae bacterium]
MSEALFVILDGAVAGTVVRLRGGRLRFDYHEEYCQQPDATPLSLSMPRQIRSHADHVVTPWLWGMLPDNEAVIRRWSRHFHVSASSPFSLLATPIGEDCAGAVRFVAQDGLERALAGAGNVQWLTDGEVAERLRELQSDSTAWLGRSFTGQFSLAGAQAKTALLLQDERWGVPSGGIPTTHILKPAVAGLDDHDLNEHLCLDAARRAGLVAAHTEVMRFGEETAVVVTRYDRVTAQGKSDVVRVHQEDLCQALGVPPMRKYQNEGGPGPADVAKLLRQALPPDVAEDAVWRFADALIWNWLIGGTDAHAKNYSLLLSGNQVRLAPLYDVASALPYGTHERKLRFAMKIGGDYRVHPQQNTWPAAARELHIGAEALLARVDELAAAAPHAFADACKSDTVVALGRELPGRLLDLIGDRASRCRKLIASGTPTDSR